MARKDVNEPETDETDDAPEAEDADLDDREKPISDEAGDEDKEYADGTLTPEQREQRRLSKKPKIDHLPDGVAHLDDGTTVPLFDVGDKIIAERHISFLQGHPWLDTRVYTVRSIDDDKGIVHCSDDELLHYACVGFKHPFTRIKLAPKKGNPFKAPKPEKPKPELAPGEKKRRGRPKGSKNRPKEIIEAERVARKQEKK